MKTKIGTFSHSSFMVPTVLENPGMFWKFLEFEGI